VLLQEKFVEEYLDSLQSVYVVDPDPILVVTPPRSSADLHLISVERIEHSGDTCESH
jgi:hypothetical protein